MINKTLLLHQQNKTKLTFLIISIIISLLFVYIGVSSYKAYFSVAGAQCRDIFDAQSLESKKKICCNQDHYNSKDEMCKIKCDTLEVYPGSNYCEKLEKQQNEEPISKEVAKQNLTLNKEAPKCTRLVITSLENKPGPIVLKPSNPVTFKVFADGKGLKPKYYLYEFFSFEGNFQNLKPISFEKGKSFYGLSPAQRNEDGIFEDQITAIHDNFFQKDLNNEDKEPKNVLMTLSIIDENNVKHLQPQSCFAKFEVDNSPSYCKSFKTNNESLKDGEKIKFTVVPNIPEVDSYEFRFQNLDNYRTSGSGKEYKFISFDIVDDTLVPFSFKKQAKGTEPMELELTWKDLYEQDLNYKDRYPERIRALVYVKPSSKSLINSLEPCKVDFELEPDMGIDLCKSIAVTGASTDASKNILLKPNQYVTIESVSKSKNIEKFTYSFYNLDNPRSTKTKDGVTDAFPIYFTKSDPFEIEKTSPKTDAKSILVSYDDLKGIDLSTGKRPTSVQVRASFKDSSGRISKFNKECVASFKIE